jgi:hypothetical protein
VVGLTLAAHGVTLAALGVVLAITQALELLLLFVVLPFVVAGLVIAFVSWRSSGEPPPIRTSEVLATGDPGSAQVVTVKPMGGFLDPRPMVRMGLRVRVGATEEFDLEVTQSIPRGRLRDIKPGETVEVRVTGDRRTGAVLLAPNGPPDA